VQEKRLVDTKHEEWELRLRNAEGGIDGKLELQSRLTQLEFDLEAEKAKSKAREVLKANSEKQKVKTDKERREMQAGQVTAAVKAVASEPSMAQAAAQKRGYTFNSFQGDVHNMMQALGRRGYLDKYAGKKVQWGSKPLNLKREPPARTAEAHAQWRSDEQQPKGRDNDDASPTVASSDHGQTKDATWPWAQDEPAPPDNNSVTGWTPFSTRRPWPSRRGAPPGTRSAVPSALASARC